MYIFLSDVYSTSVFSLPVLSVTALLSLSKKKISFCDKFNVVFFLLGDTPASEFYVPTFRNTLFHLRRRCKYTQIPKRKNTAFRTRRKFEIKKFKVLHLLCNCPIYTFSHFQLVAQYLLLIYCSYMLRPTCMAVFRGLQTS
jgi:hypothetical protein